jgi:hypothetical protein
MRFASIDPFVGAAKRAHPGFDFFHQPECSAVLLLPGAPADQAFHAEFGQGFVEWRWFLDAHVTAIYHFYAASEVGLAGTVRAHLKVAGIELSLSFFQDGDNSNAIMALQTSDD